MPAVFVGSRLRICQIFYTSKIANVLNFTREKRMHYDIFSQNLKSEDVILIYFEWSIVSFCAIIYWNTNSPQLFCENSSWPEFGKIHILGNFLLQFLKILPQPKIILYKCHACAACHKFHVC